jgi:hypothetical protein
MASDGHGPTGPEFKPKAAFRAHVANVLHVSPGEINGGADDAASAASAEHSRGGAWAYVMWHKDHFSGGLRGWVTADGTVITPRQNLGILFAEEGLWAKSAPPALADRLADDIVWSYGTSSTVVQMPVSGMSPPELTLAPDGSGTLRFFVAHDGPDFDEAGGGGGAGVGGAPAVFYFEARVLLTADHKATLTITPFGS